VLVLVLAVMEAAAAPDPADPAVLRLGAGVQIPTSMDFQELKLKLDELLGGDVADVDQIRAAMQAYSSDMSDWEEYAHWSDHCYTRNLIDDGNGKYNLMLICWNHGQASSIHTHADSHCFMKIMDGVLTEELYCKPDKVVPGQELAPHAVTELPTDDVAYISDEVGMHRISNASHRAAGIRAVSLHLYSPPYQTCKSYCEKTGNSKCSGKISFWSVDGVKAVGARGSTAGLSDGAIQKR
jgi:cysteine dioxygenase